MAFFVPEIDLKLPCINCNIYNITQLHTKEVSTDGGGSRMNRKARILWAFRVKLMDLVSVQITHTTLSPAPSKLKKYVVWSFGLLSF